VCHILDDRFDALWPAYVQPDWSLLRLEDQCKLKKGAARSLEGDELHQGVRPGVISWKAEGIAICQFAHLLHMLEELAQQKLAEVDALIRRAQAMKRVLEEELLRCRCLTLDECARCIRDQGESETLIPVKHLRE
jgi:hypothetical protein